MVEAVLCDFGSMLVLPLHIAHPGCIQSCRMHRDCFVITLYRSNNVHSPFWEE